MRGAEPMTAVHEHRDLDAGTSGKGWVFPDGHVRAWSVNHAEQPHHADVEQPGSIRFRISPDGAVEVFGPSWAQDVAVAAVRTSPTTNWS